MLYKTIVFCSPIKVKMLFNTTQLFIFLIKTPTWTEEHNQSQTSLESQMTTWSPEPCLKIELENEDQPKTVKISGKAIALLDAVVQTPKKFFRSKCLLLFFFL